MKVRFIKNLNNQVDLRWGEVTVSKINRGLLVMIFLLSSLLAQGKDPEQVKTLSELLSIGYQKNPMIASHKHRWNAESSLVASKYTPEDPKIGFSEIKGGATTQYITISQNLMFPTKYIYAGKAQASRAKYQQTQYELMKLRIRQKVVSLYYSIYSAQKIIQLTQANKDVIKKFSRVAERKYATGESPQTDQMKAHFELSNLELDLISLRQEEQALQDDLRAVLRDPTYARINLENIELPVPHFEKEKVPSSSVSELTQNIKSNSAKLKSQMNLLEEANHKSTLANWQFAPDIEFKYQKIISGKPINSHTYSVNFTFPLLFWKKNSEASAASSNKYAQKSRVSQTLHTMISNVRDLKGKVETSIKTINIYNSTLIPQAEGAYNSARGAYRASKTSFLDLLDSERALYRVKTGFYKSIRQYVHNLSRLETELGFTVSDLGTNKGVK